MSTQSQPPLEVIHLKTANIQGLASVLQSIKSGLKQVCVVVLGPDGLSIRWEDESKTMQSSVFLKPSLFVEFNCREDMRSSFGIQYTAFVDTLNVFAASADAQLHLWYPGPNGELSCELSESLQDIVVCTYARLHCLEHSLSNDLTDYWEDPVSYFLAAGGMLKEALEDLEWPGGSVQIEMQRQPQRLILSSIGASGALDIEIPISELSGFHSAFETVRFQYKYRNVKAAFSNLPSLREPGGISTKVSIDNNGLLKVTHMINTSDHVAGQQLGGFTQSQVFDGGKVGVVQFIIVAMDDSQS